ncbi:hypothetical protein BMF94_7038 [Rhodotorula taiwanensis]|uniref:SHSP domain-containing protein n=1 Tax=Rhodotorula taiwanensis TaxID=741276 RepID=A0A2S5AZN9_9BASI|nr:hypothetical protein BMF94_7038 [Rhodotorula taiwanensis]
MPPFRNGIPSPGDDDEVDSVDDGGLGSRFVGLELGRSRQDERRTKDGSPIASLPPIVTSNSPSQLTRSVRGIDLLPNATSGGSAPLRSTSRPHSSDTYSSHSSGGRSWVLDSDASSVCSSSPGTSMVIGKPTDEPQTVVFDDGTEEVLVEGGEVYRPEGGEIEFLDQRSEPAETSLQVDRSDPSQIILRVNLPGFSLDNITVAMRRGRKVHIVADAYGAKGGHYERLVFLGSDVSSSAPRAEFDGSLLQIYVQRRPSRPSSSAGRQPGSLSRSSYAFSPPDLEPLFHVPDARQSITSLWSSASLASLSPTPSAAFSPPTSLAFSTSPSGMAFSPPSGSMHSFEAPLSPASASAVEPFGRLSFDGPSPDVAPVDLDESELPPPCTARASPPPDGVRRVACVTGPEGARRAARAAREAANRRAKEEAKRLNLACGCSSGRVRDPFKSRHPSSGAESDLGGSATSSSGEGTWPPVSPTTSNSTDVSTRVSIDDRDSSLVSVDRNKTIRGSPFSARDPATGQPASLRPSNVSRTLDSAAAQLTDEIAAGSDLKSASSAEQASGSKVVSASRPKMPDSSPTIRADDRSSSFAQAVAAQSRTSSRSAPASSDGGNQTPREEVTALDFFEAPRV